VRRVLTVGVVLAVAVIVAAAFLGALGGSSGVEGRNETSVSPSGETIAPSLPTSTFPPALRSWKGVVHRTIRLDRRIGVAWEETRQFASGAHTLRVRIELPRNAEVGVWFESTSGARIDVLGSEDRSEDPDCTRHSGRDVCDRALGLLGVEDGPWRLVARKLSSGRARVRLTVAVSAGTAGTE
jgi:hypothetical protein